MARRARARYAGGSDFVATDDGITMSTRKKNAAQPRQGKCKTCGEAPPAQSPEIEALLMVGTEHVVIHSEENDNIDFMAELIDP